MLSVRKDCPCGSIGRNGNGVHGLAAFTFPFTFYLTPDAIVFAGGVSNTSSDLRLNDILVFIADLDAAHLAKNPLAHRSLGVVIE